MIERTCVIFLDILLIHVYEKNSYAHDMSPFIIQEVCC
jgi:hypothetical protein